MTDPSAMAAEAAAHHLLNDPVADPSDTGQHHRPPPDARTDDASSNSHRAPSILTFADVSDGIFQFGPPGPDGDDDYSNHHNNHQHPDDSGSSGSSSSSSSNGGTINDNYHLHQHRTHNNPNAASLPLAQPTSHYHHPRKPSPGLAARLKALGFGGVQRQLSPSSSATVGRLPEDQLRLIDQKHQANSASVEAIERRGRPWKGPGAPLQLLRSQSSRGSLFSRREHDDNDGRSDTTEATPPQPCAAEPPLAHACSLPGTAAPAPPLDMDAHKYRLPDHTNGNGTKTLYDTRHEHLERDSTPPPPPPPKDTPPEGTAASDFNPDAVSYFNPLRLHRTGSIYTISRLSFANQLAQLTSLQLPDAASLSGKISAIPTAQSAAHALINAAEQIRMWIYKASEVIDGLDSDDDVEWAAAGGREGYDEVENAISRFEDLINVYVSAIEELQGRRDIVQVSSDDLQLAVTQMESILEEWAKIRTTLKTAKSQVEIAMEWEELWNSVLGDIENEMEDLTRLVFEMEERRHKSLMAATSGDGVDIGDLETIVEETPSRSRNSRFGGPVFPLSPTSPAAPNITQDDSSLLALFARMQPLRASLDFLPMRLSVFDARASHAFPTACEELNERRTSLEASYKKLEKDAESVRKELGEDKWILVFRSAGRQAHKMIESVERSIAKLREAVDSGMHLTNPPIMAKKIESYEAKKMHYGPAIERVLSIIERGVKDRLTLNGEILRLHTEMQSSWEQVKGQMQELDVALDEMQQSDRRGEALRDSVYSLLSNDRSTVASGHETPGSSPPSSVVMSSLGLPVTPSGNKKSRSSSNASSHRAPPTSARRTGLMPPSQISRRPVGSSRMSTLSPPSTLSTPPRSASTTPSGGRMPWPSSHHQQPDPRPRWNSSVNTRDSDVGHNFKPLTLTTPSPYSRPASSLATPVRPASSLLPHFSNSKIPTLRTPSGRAGSASPVPNYTPPRPSGSRMSFRDRISSPGPYAQQSLGRPRLAPQPPPSAFDNRRASMHQPLLLDPHSPPETRRAASSMATSRRASLLPQPTGRRTANSAMSGRTTPQPTSASRLGLRKPTSAAESEHLNGSKPRWRH